MSKEIRPPGMEFKRIGCKISYDFFKRIRKKAALLECSIDDLVLECVSKNIHNTIDKMIKNKEVKT